MTGPVLAVLASLRAALTRIDVAQLSGDDCAYLVEELAIVEKACAATRGAAALRAKECGAHRARGFADASDWLACVAGSTAADAQRSLTAAAGFAEAPVVARAAASGELSMSQVHELLVTEAVCAGAAAELLDDAKRQPLNVLRERARSKRLAAADVDELHRRQHAARTFRHWQDDTGMVCGRFALPPIVGVPFVNRLDAETERIRRQARRDGSTERRDAHAADALVATATATSSATRPRRAEVVYVCDARAAARGHTHDGEPCHVVGGGPVPVSAVADAVSAGAFVKGVVHDGVRIESVVHWGRHIPAEVETALALGDPPAFNGAVCADGCGRRYGLQWDHVDPVANGGPTAFANLQPRCYSHHAAKTERDRSAGKLGTGLSRASPDHPP